MPKRIRDEEDGRLLLAKGEKVQGQRVYQVERVIGKGAFGTVYLARDEAGVPLALKEFLPAPHPRDRAQLQRIYERERDVLATVNRHELFPTLFEAFTVNGYNYLALEYVEGDTLADIIAQGALDQGMAVRWGIALCNALAYLHANDIVHHDLKSENVRIRKDSTPVILDFGAAQRYGEGEVSELFGTDGYMAPEFATHNQSATLQVDKRTDIFAMGCILYEMATGRSISQKEINAQSSFIISRLAGRLDLNPTLVNVIFTALSYDHDYRYANAQRMLEQLRTMLDPELRINCEAINFGVVGPSQPVAQEFLIYNAGGQMLNVEMFSLTAWLSVHLPEAPRGPAPASGSGRLRTNRQVVRVVAHPERITAMNQTLVGSITVRWQRGEVRIPCSITRQPLPARIVASRSSLEQTVRRGKEVPVPLRLKNLGEETARLHCVEVSDSKIVRVVPARFDLPGNVEREIQVWLDTSALPTGVNPLALLFQRENGEQLQLPLHVQVQSTVERWKGVFARS